jgi:hypothetical protein
MFVALFTAFYVTTAVMCTLYFLHGKTDIASRPQNALKNLTKYKRINLHNENITKLGKNTEKNGARLKILSCNNGVIIYTNNLKGIKFS